jgi:hypothetical protein
MIRLSKPRVQLSHSFGFMKEDSQELDHSEYYDLFVGNFKFECVLRNNICLKFKILCYLLNSKS